MFKNKTIYKKFLLIFLAIVVLYTGIIIGIIIIKQYRIISSNNNHLNMMFINHASELLDYKIEISLNTARDLTQIESVEIFMNYEPNDYFTLANVHQDISATLNNIHPFNFDIGLFRSKDDTVITSNGFFSYENYLKFIGIDTKHSLQPSKFFLDDLSNLTFVPKKSLLSGNQSIFIYRTTFFESDYTLYMFITFGRNELPPLLPSHLPNDKGHMIIWASTIEASLSSFSSESYLGFQFNNDYFTESERMNHIVRAISQNEISYSIASNVMPELYYIYVIKKADLVQLDIRFIQIVMVSFLLLLIVGIIIVFFGTKKSYSSITMILDIIKGFETQDKEEFRELDYIIEAVTKINVAHLKLYNEYDLSLNSSRENFFKSILYNVHVAEDIEHSLIHLSLNRYRNGGSLAILSIESISKMEKNFAKRNLLDLKTMFLTIMQDVDSQLKFILVPIDDKKFCLIFSTQEKELVTNFLEHLIKNLEKEFPINLTFALAQSVESIEKFHDAFKEACFLNDSRYMHLDAKIITSNSKINISDKSYIYPLNTERLLIEAIENNELEKSRKILKEILNKNLRDLNLDNYNLVKFKYVLLNTIKRILNINNKSILSFFKENPELVEEFKHHKAKKIYDAFEVAFENLFDGLSFKEEITHSHAKYILEYIHKNYTEDLSLTIIADHFSLSEGYVSKLFKEATNINFKIYLNQLKIKKAKKLLKEKNYKISEVSKMIGYHNVNTFIRVFKNIEGISPGEYKKIHRNEK